MMRLLGGLVVVALCLPATAALAGSNEENVRDDFGEVSYGGNDGSLDWSGPWVEGGESDGPAMGQIQVQDQNCSNNRCLRMRGGLLSQMSATREADLEVLSTAKLSFDLVLDPGLLSTGTFYVEARGEGADWAVLKSYALAEGGSYSKSFDVSSFAGPEFGVRFRLTGLLSSDNVHIDRVEVRGVVESPPKPSTTTSTTTSTTSTTPTTTTTTTTTTTEPRPAASSTSSSSTSSTTTTIRPTTSSVVPVDTTSIEPDEPRQGQAGTTTTVDGESDGEAIGLTGETTEPPPPGSGLRTPAVGLMADYRPGSMSGIDMGEVEVLGANLEADFSLAVEAFETARIWIAILSLFMAAAVVGGMDWRRSKRHPV